jgi:hypothetical protein
MKRDIYSTRLNKSGKVILVEDNLVSPVCTGCMTPETLLNNGIILFPGNPLVHAALLAECVGSPLQTVRRPPTPSSPEIVGIDEAVLLSGKAKATIRNRLSARDPLLLAARLPGKGYRFNRARFMKWVERCPEYATLPGIKRSKTVA